MKKLLIGTALASAMFVGAVAQAETKVSGYYEMNYRGISASNAAGTANSPNTTIGTEMDINLSSTNTLSNGMVMQIDIGTTNEQTAGAKTWGTDSYGIALTSGNTSFELAVDRGNTADAVSDLVPNPVDQPGDNIVSSTANGNAANRLFGVASPNGTTDLQKYAHLSVVQKIGSGVASVTYVPSTANTEGLQSGDINQAASKSGYGAMYKGSVMPGLEVGFGYEKITGYEYQDAKAMTYGASYTTGAISVGIQKATNDAGTGNSGETTKVDYDSLHYGISYAVNDALSVGVAIQKMESSNTTADEEYQQIEAQYSLGALGVGVSYTTVENIGGTSGLDDDQLMIRLSSKL